MAAGYHDQVIEALRAGRRVVSGDLQGQDLLLLHHRGAKSGADRVTPLLYWPAGDTSVAVLASNYGASRHPAWYHNLLAHPDAAIEIGAATTAVHARVATAGERREVLERITTTNPGVAAAVGRTCRELPVVILEFVASQSR